MCFVLALSVRTLSISCLFRVTFVEHQVGKKIFPNSPFSPHKHFNKKAAKVASGRLLVPSTAAVMIVCCVKSGEKNLLDFISGTVSNNY